MDSVSATSSFKLEDCGGSSVSVEPVELSAVPPSLRISSREKLPLASSLQDDLWHLPGRLRINPCLWDKEDVAHWLHWAQREYSLQRPAGGRFEMNGRALCLLTKEDFRRRCPSSGDVLYELLQCVKLQRTTVVHRSHNLPLPVSIQAHSTQIQYSLSQQSPNQGIQEPQKNGTQAHPTSCSAVCTVSDTASCQPQPILTSGEQQITIDSHSTPQTDSYTPTLPHTKVQSPPKHTSFREEPLNLSSRVKAQSMTHEANGRIPECRLLWDYVYRLLCDHRYQDFICWEDKHKMVFRVVDPNGLARLWGNHKNRANMTYEKMSRALRHYYKLNIIKKEPGQKLVFRFLKIPQGIGKHRVEPGESLDNSPPGEGQTPEEMPSEEIYGNHLEVSPDPASPQSDLE